MQSKAVAMAMVLGFSLACTDFLETAAPPEPTPEPVAAETEDEKVARIVTAIAADPAKAELILKAEGLSEAEVEKLLYAIARDPARSKAFEAARKR